MVTEKDGDSDIEELKLQLFEDFDKSTKASKGRIEELITENAEMRKSLKADIVKLEDFNSAKVLSLRRVMTETYTTIVKVGLDAESKLIEVVQKRDKAMREQLETLIKDDPNKQEVFNPAKHVAKVTKAMNNLIQQDIEE